MKKDKLLWIIGLLLILPSTIYSQSLYQNANKKAMNHWVDSIFDSMTNDERLGQLFIIVADPRASSRNAILKNITEQKVGGILFSKGELLDEAESINAYQKAARIPLFIALDGEWGLAMRLKDTPLFPHNAMLGAIRDNQLIRLYGEEVGRECKELGIQINFAPVLDVNSNPLNPVIGVRSFGEDPESVAAKGIAYAQGLESQQIISVGKHFPGHGDTTEDSHATLPRIAHNRARLNQVELYPFKDFINAGLAGVMTGHLSVPALDNATQLPSSLSPKIVTDLLQKELNFKGLCFTDALVMKGASAGKQSICVQALLAGNDVLLSPERPEAEFAAIKKAIANGTLSQKMIEEKCLKILRYKYITGLNNYKPIRIKGLKDRIQTSETDWLIQKLNEEAITLLKNKDNLLPVKQLGSKKIATVSLGANEKTAFQETLDLYGAFDHFQLPAKATESQISAIFNQLQKYDAVICGIHSNKMRDYAGLQALAQKKEVHLCFFIAPHLLTDYEKSIKGAESVTLAYENTPYSQKAAAEIILGGLPAKGKLPVAIASLFDYQTGLSTQKVRLSYQLPKEAGMSEATLRKIAPIVEEGIRMQAFPGCQVLVAKNGKVVYNQSFGYFDYAGTHPVENTDVYDLASVTKAVATVPAVMKLYDTGKIKLDDPLSKQIPLLQQTDKYKITIRDALFHQTGLASFLPFYMLLIDAESYEGPLFSNKKTTVYRLEYDKNTYMRTDFKFLPDRVSNTPKAGISKQVADHFYVTDDINDWAIRDIADSQLRKEKKYLYSDLNFILLKEVVENVSNQSLDVFLDQQLYADLGANYTEFLPLRTIAKEKIAPTENDRFLRNQILIGYPHDEAAAVLGGVSGNAGLFSNANDLAKIGQLFLNKGTYGGERFFDESTVKMFTHTQNSTGRRSLGFDKPNQKNLTFSISENIFGHTGYTGTCWWVDPDNQLIYVFLSNRVYPSRQHTQLQEQHIRERIQSIIYEAIK